MKTLLLKQTAVLCLIFFGAMNFSYSQCTNCSFNWPNGGPYTTTSSALTELTNCVWGGDFSTYNVISGETYTWTTCSGNTYDTQLSLYPGVSCGPVGAALAYNDDDCGLQSTITWTATFTGTVTLLVSQFNCATNATCIPLQWACTSCATIPGCTDPTATNYNPAATVDDGSCSYPGVDYVHPIAGGAGEFVGACLVNDCGPFVYTDDGGLGGDYSNNIGPQGAPHYGGIYRVFCPDMAGNCMEATFSSFITANDFDYLQVKNGPTQNSPEFAALHAPSAFGTNGMWGNLTASMPATFTSTDASGCLTFRFFSSGVNTAAGWSATLQCVPCAGGPTGTDNSDCMMMTPLCNTYSLGGDASGPGLTSDGCSFGSCPAGGENHTNWFAVTADNGGTLDISIVPDDPTDDYDFAIYGPNVTCAALGNPLRCSDAAAIGTTGTGGDTDLSEPAAGNGQVATINAASGDSYIIVVDEWSPNASGTGYTMNFGGSATLDCSILPVELVNFDVEYYSDEHASYITWKTISEKNSDHFEVQRSTDGVHFQTIHTVKGAGNTQMETSYIVKDIDPAIGVNYYRLKQVDFNGATQLSEVISVNILDDFYDLLTLTPNPTNGKTEVIFNSYHKEEVLLQVTSIEGATIIKTPILASLGGNRFDIDLSEVEGNMFFVTITTSNKTYSGKLIKK